MYGTWCNRERHATHYVAHMHARGLDHLAPTTYNVVHYMASLHHELPSSKTIKTWAQVVALLVPAIPRPLYCPVAAWFRTLQQLPAAPDAPTFLMRPGVPLTTHELTPTIRGALHDAWVPHASRYTLQDFDRPARHRAWTLPP